MVSIADEVQRRFGQIRRQPMIAWLATQAGYDARWTFVAYAVDQPADLAIGQAETFGCTARFKQAVNNGLDDLEAAVEFSHRHGNNPGSLHCRLSKVRFLWFTSGAKMRTFELC
jgi:hypothetical protein